MLVLVNLLLDGEGVDGLFDVSLIIKGFNQEIGTIARSKVMHGTAQAY